MTERRKLLTPRSPKAQPTTVDVRSGADESVGAGIERGSAAPDLPSLLGDGDLLSHLHEAQQVQMVQQLQRVHGNGEVARALAPGATDAEARDRAEGLAAPPAAPSRAISRVTVQRRPPTDDQNHEFVPEMSVKPDAAEINVGQVHTEHLDVLNARKAPAQTTFHWGGAVSDSPVLEFIDISPHDGPKANLRVQGRAPGAEALNATVEHQVPGGPPVDTQGPSPRITVKKPSISLRAIHREAAAGPEAGNPHDPTRLSVGDTLVVEWVFSNVQDLGTGRLGSVVGIAGDNKVLASGEQTWSGGNSLQQKFRAVGVGKANFAVKFQFADMSDSQAIKDTVEAHVEMPKQDFLNKTVEATAMIQTADQKATAWMDSLAVAYADAWNNHTGALKHQADNERLIGELILGAALAFVPGGIGGVIGKTMANATKAEAFICDGIKDLQKWGFRNAAPSLAKAVGGGGGGNGLTAYPTDPFMWDKLKGIRIHSELGVAAAWNQAWIHAVNANDPNFTLDFDPVQAVKQALMIEGTDLQSVAPVDIKQQSLEFEKGFWATWLEKYAYIVSSPRFTQAGTIYSAEKNVGKTVKDRCEAVGLDITPYVEKSKQAAEAQAAKQSMIIGQPH